MSAYSEILQVINLNVSTKSNKVILNKINFSCYKQEFFVIVGKNGQGKTTLSLSIANLLNKNHFKVNGTIIFDGQDILSMNELDLITLRQKDIGYISQNPFSSFDPVKKIKDQFEEQSKLKNISFDVFIDLMKQVELKSFDLILNKYPFELSGGILQRLSAVRAFSIRPKLIIADEPTSALDKPIANQLLRLFVNFVKKESGTIIFVSQDISIAEKHADRIAFLNKGEINLISDRNDFFISSDNIEHRILLEAYQHLKV